MNYSEITKLKNWVRHDVIHTQIKSAIENIPSVPGLYLICTNAPISVFNTLGKNSDKGAVDIGLRTSNSFKINNDLLIKENSKNNYCVYIGHHKNLKQRIKEHFWGSDGTGCLSLFKNNKLTKYKWEFYYLEISKLKNGDDSNLLRTILENKLKSDFGWPILCAR